MSRSAQGLFLWRPGPPRGDREPQGLAPRRLPSREAALGVKAAGESRTRVPGVTLDPHGSRNPPSPVCGRDGEPSGHDVMEESVQEVQRAPRPKTAPSSQLETSPSFLSCPGPKRAQLPTRA